jgi:hypothetical protein
VTMPENFAANCTARCGKQTGAGFDASRRSSSLGATCPVSLSTVSRMKCMSYRMTRRKVTRSERWARSVEKIAVLTGSLMGGYADDLFNVLYRLEPHKMVAEGYEWGDAGIRNFAESYGVLERVTIIPPEENACSKAKVTKQVKRKPGASPPLFGKFLMDLGAFVSLEDISGELPAYREEIIGVDMDEPLAKAYADLEKQIKEALEEHRGNHSVISTALNPLLAYPDRPYGFGDLIGTEYDPGVAPTRAISDRSHAGSQRGCGLRERAPTDRAHQGRPLSG